MLRKCLVKARWTDELMNHVYLMAAHRIRGKHYLEALEDCCMNRSLHKRTQLVEVFKALKCFKLSGPAGHNVPAGFSVVPGARSATILPTAFEGLSLLFVISILCGERMKVAWHASVASSMLQRSRASKYSYDSASSSLTLV